MGDEIITEKAGASRHRGTEVSCRMFSFFVAAEKAGLCRVDDLLRGLPVDRAHLEDATNRVAWDLWAELCDRFALAVGSEEELKKTGHLTVNPIVAGFLAPVAQLFVTPTRLYRVAYGWGAPTLYRSMKFTVDEIDGGLRVTATLLPGFRPSRAWFVMFVSSAPLVPRFFDQPDAVLVSSTLTDTAATVEIRMAKARPMPWWRRVRQTLIASDAVFAELLAQEEQLAIAWNAVRGTAQSFENVLAALPGIIALRGPDARIRYVNPSCALACGIEASALVGRDLESLFHDDDRESFRTLEPGTPRLLRMWGKGQSTIYVSTLLIREVQFNDETVELIVGRDLTGEIAARGALARSEDTLQALISAHPDHILRIDRSLLLLDVVPGRGLGDGSLLMQKIGRRVDELIVDGSSISTASLREAFDAFREAFASGRPFDLRFTVPGQSADDLRFLRARGAPILEGAEAIVVVSDETASVRATQRIAEAERLAALGTLVESISHEINNPLTYMQSNLEILREQLLRDEPPDRHDVEALVEGIFAGCMRIRDAVTRLLPLAEEADSKDAKCSVRTVVDDAIGVARNELRHRGRVDVKIETSRDARMTRNDLSRMLTKLLLKVARDLDVGGSTIDDETIAIAARDDESDGIVIDIASARAAFLPAHAPASSDSVVEDSRPEIFNFSRAAREVGATIHMQRLGGRIARISLRVPAFVAPRLEPGRAAPSAEQVTSPGRGTVLIIDDDDLVVRALARSLAAHDVTTATDVRATLDALLAKRLDPDAILCDVMMPGMPGWQVYELLERGRPDLLQRIVFVTGGTFTDQARDFAARPDVRIVKKPIPLAEVRAIVGDMVASRRSSSSPN
jgi:CheY-like chemotaxis protein